MPGWRPAAAAPRCPGPAVQRFSGERMDHPAALDDLVKFHHASVGPHAVEACMSSPEPAVGGSIAPGARQARLRPQGSRFGSSYVIHVHAKPVLTEPVRHGDRQLSVRGRGRAAAADRGTFGALPYGGALWRGNCPQHPDKAQGSWTDAFPKGMHDKSEKISAAAPAQRLVVEWTAQLPASRLMSRRVGVPPLVDGRRLAL